jgi:hypothetical protein
LRLLEARTMAKVKWQGLTDPHEMLSYLQGIASDRKLRLFACACCRRIWELLPDKGSRRAVAAAEQYADGHIGDEELHRHWEEAQAIAVRAVKAASWAAAWATAASAAMAAGRAAPAAAWAAVPETIKASGRAAWEKVLAAENKRQGLLLRDLIGDLSPPPLIAPAWLGWNGGTVVQMARSIYEDCRFEELPVLADALEEAGCGNPAILAHCRAQAEHVRACWVVDAILGKT